MKRIHFQLSLCVLLAAVIVAMPGCGNQGANQASVSGTVTLDGKPIEEGSIMLTPIEGTQGSVTGGTIKNGHYELTGKAGAAIGWNRVEIRAVRKTGKMIQKPFSPPGQTIPEKVEAIPPRYNSQSTLKVEIKSGDNTADFALKSNVLDRQL